LAIGSAILAAYLAKGFIGRKPQTEVVTVDTRDRPGSRRKP
jgi:hypothetical protein